MKIVIQRVKRAQVSVDNEIIGKINNGFLVLIGIAQGDKKENADYLVKKLINLRVFSDEQGKMNLSIKDINGELLLISQFTLYAECKKSGNRPSFSNSARPEIAEPLYEYFVSECKKYDINVETGEFGADMQVELVNDGPVTIIIED